MWDILQATTEEAKALAGSIKSVKLQTEYLGSRKMQITLHGGSLGHRRGPFGGFLCSLWVSQRGQYGEKQSGHCHQGGLLIGYAVPQGLYGHPRHLDVPWPEYSNNSGRPSTPLLVLFRHKALVKSVSLQEPDADNPAT